MLMQTRSILQSALLVGARFHWHQCPGHVRASIRVMYQKPVSVFALCCPSQASRNLDNVPRYPPRVSLEASPLPRAVFTENIIR